MPLAISLIAQQALGLRQKTFSPATLYYSLLLATPLPNAQLASLDQSHLYGQATLYLLLPLLL